MTCSRPKPPDRGVAPLTEPGSCPFGWELNWRRVRARPAGGSWGSHSRASTAFPAAAPARSGWAAPGPAEGIGPARQPRRRPGVRPGRRLLESIGVPVARLDAETAAVEGITVDLDQRAIRIGGRWICPTVTWIRHFAPQAMPARRGAALRAFSTDSWQALGDQLGAICAETIASSGAGLLQQLAAARAAGIRVPRRS